MYLMYDQILDMCVAVKGSKGTVLKMVATMAILFLIKEMQLNFSQDLSCYLYLEVHKHTTYIIVSIRYLLLSRVQQVHRVLLVILVLVVLRYPFR